jgi:lipopolysaccharide export system protein LptA
MEEGRVLWADRVVIEQQTGDAVAGGPVKASYEQPGNAEPVHVLAARAELKHDAGLAFFYGAVAGEPAAKRARLWQGGSQVEAPVLQFDQKKRSLVARGDGAGADKAVHTVLLMRRSPKTGSAKGVGGKAGAGKVGSAKTGAVGRNEEEMRVVSRELVYSDALRTADFTGGVEVVSEDGSMRAREAKVYLQAAAAGVGGGTKKAGSAAGAPAARAGQSGFMGGDVERILATGGIEIEQPGRRASGEQLVYTAEDQMFVLTGTPAAPPKMMDETRGNTTGALLRFHAGDTGDNSVVVSNEAGDDVRKVRTETRVKQKP